MTDEAPSREVGSNAGLGAIWRDDMTIRQETPTTWERTFAAYGDHNDYHDIAATAEGLEIEYDVLPWWQLDAARAALGHPTVARLLVLLAHAVKEADGWHDNSNGGPIEDDALIDEARALAAANSAMSPSGPKNEESS